MSVNRIYCDHAATTPLDPAVLEAMLPWLSTEFGNASSLYAEGRRAKDALDEAREALSAAVECLFAEVVFTSSATEAINLGLLGVARAAVQGTRKRILLSASEHPAVLECRVALERMGYTVELIPVTETAQIDLQALRSMIADDVLLVAAMQANNETGAVNDIRAIIEVAKQHGSLVFIDAVQGFLTPSGSPFSLGADLVAVSSHKIYGPKGAGALVIRGGVEVQPLVVGGAQEREMRAGTENVAAIVGFGAAVRGFQGHQSGAIAARDAFRAEIGGLLGERAKFTVPPDVDCLPGHCHLRIPGLSIESALINLDQAGVCASSGSACSAGSVEPSHVMMACGMSATEAKECLRFSFGRHSTPAEAQEAARRLAQIVARLDAHSS